MEFKALENDLVSLIPLQARDFDRLYAVGSDKEIWAQHPDSKRHQPAGFRKYFSLLLDNNIAYLIVDKASDQIIGATSYYQYDNLKKTVAIGFTFLAKAYWGGKYNKSVKHLMISYALGFVNKVIFHVREKNYRSQAALTKIGAIRTDQYPSKDNPESLQLEYSIEIEGFSVVPRDFRSF